MEPGNRSVVESGTERELTIVRVFDVPARVLFEAHSKPEHVLQWFGPTSYPLALCEMDFRVGGKYRFAMKGPDGKLMTAFGGEYLEIVKDRKISYSNTMELPGAETMRVTITLKESAGKTTLTHHTSFASAAQKREHVGMGYEQGVGSGLDQLREVASRMAA
jgi:uncharacterized protein YndB with AHSA1/START domain